MDRQCALHTRRLVEQQRPPPDFGAAVYQGEAALALYNRAQKVKP
ncbi:MAG: hypothetical protein ACRDYF_11660 [Acidimicrobiia bacterium]